MTNVKYALKRVHDMYGTVEWYRKDGFWSVNKSLREIWAWEDRPIPTPAKPGYKNVVVRIKTVPKRVESKRPPVEGSMTVELAAHKYILIDQITGDVFGITPTSVRGHVESHLEFFGTQIQNEAIHF